MMDVPIQRSAYTIFGIGLFLVTTPTSPIKAEALKGRRLRNGRACFVARPAVIKRIIPGTRAQMVIRRNGISERPLRGDAEESMAL